MKDLQAGAKAMGMWAMFIGPEAGGTGTGFLPYAFVNEILGRSPFAPRAFGCAAPDTGNAEILHQFGTPEQKQRWLKPLVDGDIRSCFSMTEPEVSGADPTGLRTRAVRDGDEWVINGHKWFTSGAIGATFAIVMAVTDPDAEPHQRMSQIIVPDRYARVQHHPARAGDGRDRRRALRDPIRGLPRAGHQHARRAGRRLPHRAEAARARAHPSLHALARPDAARVRDHVPLRAPARRSAARRSPTSRRSRTGSPTRRPTSRRARLLTLHAAHKIDQGDEARVEISMIKFLGAKVLHDVIDRAIQVHGARGVSGDTPLESMYRNARAARIYDGPDEVHRMVVARRILREFQRRRHLGVRVREGRLRPAEASPRHQPGTSTRSHRRRARPRLRARRP